MGSRFLPLEEMSGKRSVTRALLATVTSFIFLTNNSQALLTCNHTCFGIPFGEWGCSIAYDVYYGYGYGSIPAITPGRSFDGGIPVDAVDACLLSTPFLFIWSISILGNSARGSLTPAVLPPPANPAPPAPAPPSTLIYRPGGQENPNPIIIYQDDHYEETSLTPAVLPPPANPAPSAPPSTVIYRPGGQENPSPIIIYQDHRYEET